ncbi:hypothetical protein BDD43_0276 [Mucilaginibacter gracilis]|uniref:Lipoprotein n=1 Tax=Mucilaginibacter gracilis TaxID=423350 RepID=A0A495IU22_9SPHI|nr:hypothetical protein [Mucilaginibacter gracilis]RKR80180.1 hypothetical protein BDD43_0276 [Mucilaginibacter gracilis]
MPRLILCFFLLVFVACHAPSVKQNQGVNIRLAADSQSVCITGLDYSVLQEMKKDSLTTENWQGIFPVYHMPADTDMKDLQNEQPGSYRVADSTITFTPDTAFKKHQQYFARFYGNTTNFSTSNLIRSKTNLKGQNYTEVVFKF